MQTNLSINNQPAFKAAVSENFIKAAHNYFYGVEYNSVKTKLFDLKAAKVSKEFGYDDFVIKHKKVHKDGKIIHTLSADKDNLSIPLTTKDKFRKIIEKFRRMTKYEFDIKMKQFFQEHPEI